MDGIRGGGKRTRRCDGGYGSHAVAAMLSTLLVPDRLTPLKKRAPHNIVMPTASPRRERQHDRTRLTSDAAFAVLADLALRLRFSQHVRQGFQNRTSLADGIQGGGGGERHV